jgi:hypothetical protein
MAITITAKLDTKGVTDGAKDVVDSVNEMGDAAKISNEAIEQAAKELQAELDEVAASNDKMREQLGILGDEGSAAFGKIKITTGEVIDSVRKYASEGGRSIDEIKKRIREADAGFHDAHSTTQMLKAELASVGNTSDGSLAKVERSAEAVSVELKSAAASGRELTTSLRDAGLQASDTASGANFDEIVEDLLKVETQVTVTTNNSSDNIQRVGETAKKTGKDIVDSQSSVQGTITALATGYLAVVDILKKGYQAALKFDATMRTMAESGNEGAMKVVGALDKIWDRLDKIGSDPTTQQMFDGMAGGAGLAEGAMGGLMSAWTAFSDRASRTAIVAGTAMGVVEEGTIAAHDEMTRLAETERATFEQRKAQAAEQKKLEQEKEESAKRLSDVEADLSRQKAAIHGHEDDLYLKRMTDQDKVREYIARETEELKKKSKESELSDAERERRLEGIRLAEQRLIDIEKERFEARKEQIKAEEEAEEQAIRDSEEAQKREHEERMQRIEDETQARQKAEDDRLAAEREAMEQRKRLVLGSELDGAKKVLGGQTREQVRDAYAQKKGDESAAAMEQTGGSEKEIARQRKRSVELAKRQFDSGKADDSEIREVQSDLAGKTVNAAQQQGKMSQQTATIIKDAIAEMAKNANEMDQLKAELGNIQQMQSGVSRQGERRRAQVAGSRQ